LENKVPAAVDFKRFCLNFQRLSNIFWIFFGFFKVSRIKKKFLDFFLNFGFFKVPKIKKIFFFGNIPGWLWVG
jgi:hypothetical protein